MDFKSPNHIEELSTILKTAYRDSLGVVPWGTGTHQRMGHPPSEKNLVLKLGNLNKVIEHAENDLTITVESGMTFANLQEFLRPAHQFFPFFEPNAESRTLGGIIACGSINHLAYRYGHLRDLVLGVSVCQADGIAINGGGKVVKNVSGYEMPKLFIGSLGSLGIITSFTLRLSSLPQKTSLLKATFRNISEAISTLNQLFRSKLLPSTAFVYHTEEKIIFFARIEGDPRFVQDQIEKTITTLRLNKENPITIEDSEMWTCPLFSAPEKGGKSPVGTYRSTFLEAASNQENSISSSGFVPPFRLINLHEKIKNVSSKSNLKPTSLFFINGGYEINWSGSSKTNPLDNFRSLNHEIAELGGWISYKSVPEQFWKDWPMWGEKRPEWGLSARLKTLFDQKNILNPGRFVNAY